MTSQIYTKVQQTNNKLQPSTIHNLNTKEQPPDRPNQWSDPKPRTLTNSAVQYSREHFNERNVMYKKFQFHLALLFSALLIC